MTKNTHGLFPKKIWLLGSGVNREQIKDYFFEQNPSHQGFLAPTILTLEDFAKKVIQRHQPQFELKLLSEFGRVDLLKVILNEPRLTQRLPYLVQKFIQNQTTLKTGLFLKRLDQNIQRARAACAHVEEAQVWLERCEEWGVLPIRREMLALQQVFESFLKTYGVQDTFLLYQRAIDLLDQYPVWPEVYTQDTEEVVFFYQQESESLESLLLEKISQLKPLQRLSLLNSASLSQAQSPTTQISSQVIYEEAHTWDDAAQFCAEQLKKDIEQYGFTHLVIPEDSSIRRSLLNTLEKFKLPLCDPRDPAQYHLNELVKSFLLQLKVAVNHFQLYDVVSYLESVHPEFRAQVKDLYAQGMREGIQNYQGIQDKKLKTLLNEISGEHPQVALKWSEFCDWFQRQVKRFSQDLKSSVSLIEHLEAVLKTWTQENHWLLLEETRYELREWYEQLSERLSRSLPVTQPFYHRQGVHLFRVGQVPLPFPERVHLFAIPSDWHSSQARVGDGDDLWNERDRFRLSSEFKIKSSSTLKEERIQLWKQWFGVPKQVNVWHARYHSLGAEVKPLHAFEEELKTRFGMAPWIRSSKTTALGRHPRWLSSERSMGISEARDLKLELQLTPWKEFTASWLNEASECEFKAVVYRRWKVDDVEEPGLSLGARARGMVLHAAVRLILEKHLFHLAEERQQDSLLLDILEQAWEEVGNLGIIQHSRNCAFEKKSLLKILKQFVIAEWEFKQRSQTKTVHLEGPSLELVYDDVKVRGLPDRIDLFSNEGKDEGLWIIDYKSSTTPYTGKVMLEKKLKLQLPFYAIAAQKQLKQKVLGVQFVTLNESADRSRGIFFEAYNGSKTSDEPALTVLTKRNGSLLVDHSPDEVWEEFESEIRSMVLRLSSGKYSVKPKVKNLCHHCRAQNACGMRRLNPDVMSEVSEPSSGEVS